MPFWQMKGTDRTFGPTTNGIIAVTLSNCSFTDAASPDGRADGECRCLPEKEAALTAVSAVAAERAPRTALRGAGI